MKKQAICVIGMVLVFLASCRVVLAGSLENNRYYTWQIPEPNIPIGSIITGVQITLYNLITANSNEGLGIVEIRLVDNCLPGWISNNGSIDVGSLLATPTANDANSVIDLADVILADSWTHSIFKQPFQISCPTENGFELLTMNAATLEFNDYMGNDTSVGLMVRSIGGRSTVSRISVQMTIRAYTGDYNKSVVTIGIDVPKDMVYLNAWANEERLKLMSEFMERLTGLEIRIREAMK